MSKEKVYAVKDDEGKCWDFDDFDGEFISGNILVVTRSEASAEKVANRFGAHIVTFVEEPERYRVKAPESWGGVYFGDSKILQP